MLQTLVSDPLLGQAIAQDLKVDKATDEHKVSAVVEMSDRVDISEIQIMLGLTSKTDEEIAGSFREMLDREEVNLVKLRQLAITGKLMKNELRSLAWKLFLGYLPSDTTGWNDILTVKREGYEKLRQSHRTKPDEEEDDPNLNNPLMDEADSKWNQYLKDNELIHTIELDLKRTYPELAFFSSRQTRTQMLNILFTWCKSHSQISYRQGMHELLAPILLVNTAQRAFLNQLPSKCRGVGIDDEISDKPPSTDDSISVPLQLLRLAQDKAFIEHDSYFVFNSLMSSMGQFYRHDHSRKESLPIVQKCRDIQSKLLYKVDAQYSNYLNDVGIEPQLYGLRWIRLLFSREFHIRDVCGLWDGIFSEGFEIVDYLCVAMLLFVKKSVIDREQHQALRRIMKYPPVEDVHVLILKANNVRVLAAKYEARREQAKAQSTSLLPGPFQDYLPSYPQVQVGVSSALGRIGAAVNSAGKRLATNRQERQLMNEIEKHEVFQNQVGLKCEKVVTRLEKMLCASPSKDDSRSLVIQRSKLEACLADLKLATHLLLKQVDVSTITMEDYEVANVEDDLSIDQLVERVS